MHYLEQVVTREFRPPDPKQNRSADDKGLGPLHLLVWLSISFSVYVLSTGPVIRIAKQADDTPISKIAIAAYYPLEILSNHSQPVEDFFDWYVLKLWGAH